WCCHLVLNTHTAPFRITGVSRGAPGGYTRLSTYRRLSTMTHDPYQPVPEPPPRSPYLGYVITGVLIVLVIVFIAWVLNPDRTRATRPLPAGRRRRPCPAGAPPSRMRRRLCRSRPRQRFPRRLPRPAGDPIRREIRMRGGRQPSSTTAEKALRSRHERRMTHG